MSGTEEVILSLKVMINSNKTKVLFAEANSDFVDVLLSFLTLPLGKIANILNDNGYAPPIGSLTTLYRSILNLDNVIESRRPGLLNPAPSISEVELSNLKLNPAQPAKLYTFSDDDEAGYGKRKRYETRARNQPETQAAPACGGDDDNDDDDDAVFVVNTESFLITDDLQIVPVVRESILQSLMKIGVTNTDGAFMKIVDFNLNKMKDLLRRCFTTETPLTDIVLRRRSMRSSFVEGDLLPKMERRPSSCCKKMSVKAMVQKSTNKVLVVEAEEDFVHFILSFLTLPLGAVECLFGGQTCGLRTVDNLYRSVACIDELKYLKTKDTKEMLLKPKLHHYYIPQNQFLPLDQEGLSPHFCCYEKVLADDAKGPATYIVTDDLTVMPFCLISSVSILNALKVPLSDVREMNLQIGDEEGLEILRAALTSNSALTGGLFNQKSKLKRPKQEC